MSGAPVATEEEANTFQQMKIEWAYDAILKWTPEAREDTINRVRVTGEDIYETGGPHDALAILYLEDLSRQCENHLKPKPPPKTFPKPTVDVTRWCS